MSFFEAFRLVEFSMKNALITGVTGQDGRLLAGYLTGLGYKVIGWSRSASTEVNSDVACREVVDLTDHERVRDSLREHAFDEIYHLAAESFAGPGGASPTRIYQTNIIGTENLLASVAEIGPNCRVFVAGSAAAFGAPAEAPQNELTPMGASNPYGLSKLACHHLVQLHRSAGLFVAEGILFNHESVLRPPSFVTRKITSGVAAIVAGRAHTLALGNIDALRDWGSAEDFVRGFHLMLQHEQADDYVLATGESRSVADVCDYVFGKVGLDYRNYVEVAKDLVRCSDALPSVGDASKAEEVLGWKAEIPFEAVLEQMLGVDLESYGVAAGEYLDLQRQ